MSPTDFMAALAKGKAAPVYFLRGADRLLHEVCREALENAAPAEARDWCLSKIEFEPGRLAQALQGADQMPMLGGHNFFLFSDPEDFKHASEEDSEALAAYLDRPSNFSTVVFAAVEPDRRRRFVQLLEKKTAVVEIRPLQTREAAAWVGEFLRRAGVEIEAELAREIAAKFENTNDRNPERTGVNLLRLRTELEKFLTAKPGAKRLERADLELVVEFREEHQISAFLRALAERNFARALERLRALLSSKTAETLLLWCIGDFIRQALKQSSSSLSGGAAGGNAAPYVAWRGASSGNPTWEIAASALGKYSRLELLRGLRLTRQTDLGIKSSWKDSRILLEFLVWQIVVGKGLEEAPEMPQASAEA